MPFEDRYRDPSRFSQQTLEDRPLVVDTLPQPPLFVDSTGRQAFANQYADVSDPASFGQPLPPVRYPAVDVRLGDSPFTRQYEPGVEDVPFTHAYSQGRVPLGSVEDTMARDWLEQKRLERVSGLAGEYESPYSLLSAQERLVPEQYVAPESRLAEGYGPQEDITGLVERAPSKPTISKPSVSRERFLKEADEALADREESFMDRWMREGRDAFGGAMSEQELKGLFAQGLAASGQVEKVEAGLTPKVKALKGVDITRLSDTTAIKFSQDTGKHEVIQTSGAEIGKPIKASQLASTDPKAYQDWRKLTRDTLNNTLKNMVTTAKDDSGVIINMQALLEEPNPETKKQLFAKVLQAEPKVEVRKMLTNQWSEGIFGVQEGDVGYQTFEELIRGIAKKPTGDVAQSQLAALKAGKI